MIIIDHPNILSQILKKLHQKNRCIALVPTMGNLHAGHMSLVKSAKAQADIVIVSIFINPMQFNCKNDLESYPRTLQEDYEKLLSHNIDIVFSPIENKVMYPKGLETQSFIEVPNITSILEGKSRPGHFRGVATIISKLFNLIKPNIVFFGEKDFQQLFLIRQLVQDLNYDIQVIGIPTVRANDGLALSSRNRFLSQSQRNKAPILYKVMLYLAKRIKKGEMRYDILLKEAALQLNEQGLIPDSLEICDADTLTLPTSTTQRLVILFSVWIEKTRLIDNIQVNLYHNHS
ncbi:pantoate--beta-alanine ligase [Candidatus Schneideria nysicola]|uniref:pantoate--beta-alanine ligase n=1 Tax=Candidatus Schneideria nysicola TaxID=1081631 RepID=UPI001CAA616F|nr:pantoate--beta-alanine ligase [Candidatus Schneideria nysicola]UAJ66222.1 pantoate--beta-alanine ligase [Candidatus Schneideria nysicola]